MIEYRSESVGEERPDDATGELRAGRSLIAERFGLAGRSRRVRLAVQSATVLVLLAAVVVAVLVGRHHSGGPTALPPVDPSSTGRPSALDDLSRLTAPGQFTTTVRESGEGHPCPLTDTGHDPVAGVTAAVGQVAAGARVIGVSRTVDQFHGLCALTVALVDTRNARLTVSVTAPTTIAGATAAPRTVPRPERADGLVAYAVVGWRTGWWLLVGVVGYPGEVATSTQLTAVANSPTLLW